MSKKRLLWTFLSFCLILSMVIAPMYGCGKADVEEQKIYRLTAAVSTLPSQINPFLASGAATITCLSRVYEPLVVQFMDGSIGACLAKSWEYNATNKTYIIHLNEKAKWSDGIQVTADDVKYTFDIQFEKNLTSGARAKSWVSSIDVVDSTTVKFTLKEAFGSFMDYLTSVYICPKHIWTTVGDISTYLNPTPVGSGPFLWTEYKSDSYLLLTKNPNYYGEQGGIDELVIKRYALEEAADMALRAGEVDMTSQVLLYAQIPLLLADSNIKVILDRTTNYHSLLFVNHRFPPNNVKQFRQAVSMVIDRQSIIDTACYGYGEIPGMVPFIAPTAESKWQGAGKTKADRIAAANALLDGLGYTKDTDGIRIVPNVGRLEIELVCQPDIAQVRASEIIQSSVKDIGIKITIKTTETSTLVALLSSGKQTTAWRWVLFNRGAVPGFDAIVTEWADDPFNVWYGSAAVGWTDATLQGLLKQWRRETNATTRDSLQKQAMTLFTDQLPVLTIYHQVRVTAYRTDRFEGWTPFEEYSGNGTSGLLLSNAALAKIKPISE